MSEKLWAAGDPPAENDDALTGQGQSIEMEQAIGNRLAGNSTTPRCAVYDANDAFHERRIQAMKARILVSLSEGGWRAVKPLWPAFRALLLSRSPAQIARMEAEFWRRVA